MNPKHLITAAVTIAIFAGCKKNDPIFHFPGDNIKYPDMAEAVNPRILATANGVTLYNGGYGSAMAQDPTDPSVFYLMTDRGPNVTGSLPNSIVIATPDFHPQIGKRPLQDRLLSGS